MRRKKSKGVRVVLWIEQEKAINAEIRQVRSDSLVSAPIRSTRNMVDEHRSLFRSLAWKRGEIHGRPPIGAAGTSGRVAIGVIYSHPGR